METKFKFYNLTEILESKSKEKDRGITFISSGNDECFVSYSDLFDQAISFLRFLKTEFNLKKGSELILYEEDNHKFLVCFWACIIGGIVPVPLTIGGKEGHKMKFFKIWKNLKNPYLFTNHNFFSILYEFGKDKRMNIESEKIKLNFVNSSQTLFKFNPSKLIKNKSQDIAFIQYSSGSTGDPKGVVLSHKNLIYNTYDIVERIGLSIKDNALSWIPLTHDLGMIGFHLSCTLVGCNQFIMPTSLFIRRPMLWMEKTHQHRASRLYSPNFGYQYFLQSLRRHQDLQKWNLSFVKSIFNGAEPISAELCRDFTLKLSLYGMSKNCITPCYGLAEASVGVTCGIVEEPLKEYFLERKSLSIGSEVRFADKHNEDSTVSFVGAGKPFTNCQVRIKGGDNSILGAGIIGHIEINGSNVTNKYYNNQQSTKEAFTKDGWLKTGDLGMLLQDSSLIITGRHKNMIILQGQNYYAHDIEGVLLGTSGIELGKVVACGIPGNSKSKEQLIIFILYKRPVAKFIDIAKSVQEKLSNVLGIIPDEIIPIREIPKTTSGKVQHGFLLNSYLRGAFDKIVHELNEIIIKDTTILWRSLTEKEKITQIKSWLLNHCANLIHVEPETLNTTDPLGDQGFKSIHAVQLSQIVNKSLGLSSNATLLYKYPSINQLTELINSELFPELKKTENNTEIYHNTDDSILDILESLSEDEAIKILESDL